MYALIIFFLSFFSLYIAVNEKNNLQDENKKITEQFQQLQKELE